MEVSTRALFIQDKEDDIHVGVKSTALYMGDKTKIWLSGFSAVVVSCFTLTGVMAEQAWPYYLGLGVVGTHLFKQVRILIVRIYSACIPDLLNYPCVLLFIILNHQSS